MAVKKDQYREDRRTERINKGFRERKHQRRASESLRRIRDVAKNIEDADEYFEELDELYDE